MKSKFKMVSILLVTMLVLAAFPNMSAHAACFNAAWFIADRDPLDNTQFAPGATFSKSWIVQNAGTCTWDTSYELVNIDDPFGVTTPVPLLTTGTVGPQGTVTVTVPGMVAPSTPGIHYSNWKLSDGSGGTFGVGGWWGGGVPIYAKINVVAAPAVTYDFAANFTSATWASSTKTHTLPFPTPPGSDGYAEAGSAFKFETNVTPTQGILVIPDSHSGGFIQADYTTTYEVSSGDRFQATIGCEFSATACHVRFIVKYRDTSNGSVVTLVNYPEKHERLTRKIDINLSSLAGKKVQFILRAEDYLYPSGAGASAIWGNPVIVGTGTSTVPSTSGWNTYMDTSAVPFTFMYPSASTIDYTKNTISLPKGTSTVDKKLVISKPAPGATAAVCLSSIPNPPTSPTIFNSSKGIEFNKEESTTGDVWIAYTAIHADSGGGSPTCVSLAFKLSSSGTPADLADLETIVNTFEF